MELRSSGGHSCFVMNMTCTNRRVKGPGGHAWVAREALFHSRPLVSSAGADAC